jgi:hypothetical protein
MYYHILGLKWDSTSDIYMYIYGLTKKPMVPLERGFA